MKLPIYPFSAIARQDQMKLALLLAAVDWHLGVLLRGDKGAGKTTTARGLAMLLPEPAPFVNLPIGATEDRLLGGLNLDRALKGEPVLKPGLLSEAHGGVLYIDEINLLPAHLGDALLDTASSGVNVVEREGFSASHSAEFVLLGSMNPEEGLLRPQLLDRFALSADIAAPLEPSERQLIVERRIAFERNTHQFIEDWLPHQNILREKIVSARQRLNLVICPDEILAHISTIICEQGVRSLRADLSAVRASTAYAALMNEDTVGSHHVDTILPLVLNHRVRVGGHPSSSPRPPSPPLQEAGPAPPRQSPQQTLERIFTPAHTEAPTVRVSFEEHPARGENQTLVTEHPGQVVGNRRTESPAEIDLRATLSHAILETGHIRPRASDLHEKVRRPKAGVRYLFLIDSSGSHAAQEKMRIIKGVALSILERSFRKDDEVAIIAFRGTRAQILLEPSRRKVDAITALEYLPTGGRTPLAHALELAKTYVTPSTLLILLSDGRANVPLGQGDPWQDALKVAEQLHCRSLVVDTEDTAQPLGRATELARVLRASLVNLAGIEEFTELKVEL